MDNGVSSSEYIHQIGKRLENSKDNNKRLYQSAFVAVAGGVPVGYLFISSSVNDEVFLEEMVMLQG